MTTETTTYNGWTNYETWAVNLWIGNDQESYSYWQDAAQDARENPQESEVWTPEEAARYTLAERLEQEIEAGNPLEQDDAQPSLYSDLMRAALSEVNWSEIAAALLDQSK